MTALSYRYEFEMQLAQRWPPQDWCGSHVVLGVSGGADSVAMLRAMVALKKLYAGRGKLHVGHLNHGLRGTAADEDAAWLQSLCRQLDVSLEVARTDVSTIAADQGDGWEAAARTARYDFLMSVAERLGARYVAVAHTADDQVETVLQRIFRGTGIEGLSGMRKVRSLTTSVALVRPLLSVRRCDVLEYLAAIGQHFRTDATNEDTQWTRNRLRHELLPHVREHYNRKVDSAILRLAAQAGESQQLIVAAAAKMARECVIANETDVRIDCRKLAAHPPIIVREICKIAWSQSGWPEQSMGFDQWQQLAAMAEAPSPCPLPKGEGSDTIANLPGNIRAHREGQFLVLCCLPSKGGTP